MSYRDDAAVERALASVPRARPRPEFLAALKVQFMSVAGASAPARASAPVQHRARSRFLRFAVAAGLAAALITAWRLSTPRAAHWSPVDGHLPTAPLTVDGVTVSPAEIDRALADPTTAHTIATGPQELWLQLGQRVMFELAPETEIGLAPHAAGDPSLAVAATKGSLRVCTGEAFPGSTLTVKTPDFELVVTGTSFAIDIDGEGTCVCCLDGRVVVKAPSAFEESWAVDGGRMCRIYNDGRAPKWDVMNPKHSHALLEFDEEADERIR